MRPVTLTMSAFGPYAEEVVLDFRVLAHHDIFLITGPTGSGKSTIFEALFYALYGEISQSGRSVESFCSDFPKNDTARITYVELVFSVGQKTYRIRRQPTQQVPYKNKAGHRLQSATVSLTEEVAFSSAPPLTNVKEVNERLKDIIGLNADQFKKIIMIPQGSFQEFLMANTREKQTILRDIFGTSLYVKVQKIAFDRTKQIQAAYRDQQNAFKTHLTHLSWEGAPDLPEGPFDVLEKVIAEEIGRMQKQWQQEQNSVKNLHHEAETVRDDLAEAVRHNEAMARWQTLKSAFADLEKQHDEMQAYRQRVEQGEKAQTLIGDDRQTKAYKSQWVDAQERYKQQQKAEQELRQDYADTKIKTEQLERHHTLSAQKKETLPLRRMQLEELVKWQGLIQRIQQEKTRFTLERDACTKIEADRQALIQQEQTLEQTVLQLRQQLEHEGDVVRQTANLKHALNQTETILPLLTLQATESRELQERNREKEKAAALEKAKEAQWQHVQVQQQRNHALALARTLQPGNPCPVCGAKTHPHPAIETAIDAPDLDTVETEWREARITHQKKATAVMQLQMTLAAHREQLNRAGFQVDGNSDWQGLIKATKQQLTEQQAEYRNLEIALAEMNRARKRLKQTEANVQTLKTKRAQLEKDLREKEHATQQSQITVQTLTNEQTSMANRLPKPLPDVVAFRHALQKDENWVAEIEKEWKVAQERMAALHLRMGKAETATESTKLAMDEAHSRYQAQLSAFKHLQAKLFASPEAYQNALRDIGQLGVLRQTLQTWEANRQSHEAQLLQYEQTHQTLTFIDTAAQEDNLKKLTETINQRQEKQIVRKEQIENNQRVHAQLVAIAVSCAQLEEDYHTSKHVERIISGDNAMRYDLETFVLSHYFENVLHAANKRLRTMSAGRYRFLRQEAGKDKRRLAGLELDVLDFYTGKPRSVGTLSGGERFKASLALALGLSDVVGEESGGIELSTMFIDEGFGTLDEDALDQTIDTLMSLQRHGRLVGIISHVPELKERIPAQLRVQQTDSGSRASFQVST